MDGTPSVVVVGAASRDVVEDDPRGWRLGGGVSYCALTLARLGLRVGALVGADAPAARAAELDLLRMAGVDVVIAPLEHGPVFVNRETPNGRVQHAPDVSDPVRPEALPPAWRDARGWLFGPVAAELPDAWAGIPPAGARVALGWQGLLRVLEAGRPVTHRPPVASPIVRRADLVGVGSDDLDPTIRLADLVSMLHPGATLLLTNGVHGGLAIEAGLDGAEGHRRAWQAIPVRRSIDPVGAGDTFLAGVFAAHVEPRLVGGRTGGGWDLRLGAAVGSLVIEGPGLLGVPDRAAVARRMAEAPTHH
ncbi:MAG: PfkB family carbohydrate kinase [Chloroflexota bacterium]